VQTEAGKSWTIWNTVYHRLARSLENPGVRVWLWATTSVLRKLNCYTIRRDTLGFFSYTMAILVCVCVCVCVNVCVSLIAKCVNLNDCDLRVRMLSEDRYLHFISFHYFINLFYSFYFYFFYLIWVASYLCQLFYRRTWIEFNWLVFRVCEHDGTAAVTTWRTRTWVVMERRIGPVRRTSWTKRKRRRRRRRRLQERTRVAFSLCSTLSEK